MNKFHLVIEESDCFTLIREYLTEEELNGLLVKEMTDDRGGYKSYSILSAGPELPEAEIRRLELDAGAKASIIWNKEQERRAAQACDLLERATEMFEEFKNAPDELEALTEEIDEFLSCQTEDQV